MSVPACLDDGEIDTTAIVCNGVSFQDEFETSGGSCAAGAAPLSWIGAVLLLARRRRR